ncbi:unannotated protein [freshwater metagenome]|uniref:Unannotated protein n=1 Tax=freshwater metagenome TaxID=449393 RepID=A0A6J6N544_9ZZZZ|nr:hypothetical protein [Actinomycetota bacterium]
MNKKMSYPRELKKQILALEQSLVTLLNDPEQEVTGNAAVVMDTVIDSARAIFPDHPTILQVQSPTEWTLWTGSPMRAADALLIVQQINAIVGPFPAAVG